MAKSNYGSTERSVFLSNKPVWDELYEMQKESLMCDIKLVGKDRRHISAHSCVLAASSKYLKTTLAKLPKNSGFRIELPSISAKAIQGMLGFIYTGSFAIPSDEVAGVRLTAKALNIDCLFQMCSQVCEKKMDDIEIEIVNGSESVLQSERNIQATQSADEQAEEQVLESSPQIANTSQIQVSNPISEMYTDIVEEGESHITGNEENIIQFENDVVEITDHVPTEAESDITEVEDSLNESGHVNEEISLESQMTETCNPVIEITSHVADAQGEVDSIAYETESLSNQQIGETVDTNVMVSVEPGHQETGEVIVENYNEEETAEIQNGACLEPVSKLEIAEIQDSVPSIMIENAGHQQYVSVELQNDNDSVMTPNDKVCTAFVTLPPDVQVNPDGTITQEALQVILNQVQPSIENVQEAKVSVDELPVVGKTEKDDLYRCDTCDFTSSSVIAFRDHVVESKHDIRRRDIKPATSAYSCSKCGQTFKYKHNLKTHMNRHLIVKPFMCKEENCRKQFASRNDLVVHSRVHSGTKPYICDYCYRGFSQSSNLLTHKRSVHNEEFLGGARDFVCAECGNKFKTKDMLRKHQKRHLQTFTCPHCEAQFRTRKDFMKHTKVVHEIEEPFIPAKEDGDNLELYQCPHCEKMYIKMGELNQHITVVHEQSKRFNCPHPGCKYSAYYKYAIQRHYRKHQKLLNTLQDEPLKCKHCNVLFNGVKAMRHHLKTMHNIKTPTDADFYGDNEHEHDMDTSLEQTEPVLHSTELSESQNDQDNGVTYIKKEVVGQDDQVTSADQVSSLYKDSQVMDMGNVVIRHKREEASHLCEECGAHLCNANSLAKHRQLHKSKRDVYICTECNKTFLQKPHMKRHIVQHHSGYKRFKCAESRCDYEAYYYSQMKEHYSYRHKTVPIPETTKLRTKVDLGEKYETPSRFQHLSGKGGGLDIEHKLKDDVEEDLKIVKEYVKECSEKFEIKVSD